MLIKILLRLLFGVLEDQDNEKRASAQRRARMIKMRQQGQKMAAQGKSALKTPGGVPPARARPVAPAAVNRKATRR